MEEEGEAEDNEMVVGQRTETQVGGGAGWGAVGEGVEVLCGLDPEMGTCLSNIQYKLCNK